MELLEQDIGLRPVVQPALRGLVDPVGQPTDELAARCSIRGQIAKLERALANAFVTAYPMGGLDAVATSSYRDARMLTLGELEAADPVADAAIAFRTSSCRPCQLCNLS